MADQDTNPAAIEPRPSALYLVLGATESIEGKLLWTLVEIADAARFEPIDVDGLRKLYYPGRVRKDLSAVGGIYRIETPREGAIHSSTAVFEGWPEPTGLAALLSAKSRAIVAEIEGKRAAKKREREDPFVKALGPIRDAYIACTPSRRAYLLAEIVERITRR